MPELKRTFLKGRMNKDLDERLLPSGEYRDAVNIQVSTSEGSDVGAIETIIGNTEQTKRNTGGGTWATATSTPFGFQDPSCIGATRDTQNNKIYWFIVDENNEKSAVLEYDESNSVVAVVIADIRTGADQVLNFSKDNLITGINIIDDMLFWTDNLNEPRKINISTFKASPTNKSSNTINATTTLLSKKTNTQIAFTAEDINVVKKAPMKAAGMRLFSSDILNGDLSGTGIDPVICSAFNFNDGTFPKTGSQTLSFTSNVIHPVFKNKNIELRATIKNTEGVKEKYLITANVTAATANSLTITLLTVPADIPNYAVPWSILIIEPEFIYKREFPRFSYRWKYSDGEYSAIAPFTEPAFIPGVYEYESMEAENEAMINHLRRIELLFPDRLTTFGPPRDVEYVEVLYKSSKSNNIHVIKTAQLKTPSTTVTQSENPPFAAVFNDGEFNQLIINKEIEGPLLDSSQLLRVFDAVPKKAQSQEIIANRIVYGNYTEGYDEPDDKPVFDLNIVGEDSFPTTLSGEGRSAGLPSVKSDKTYQIGVAFLDDFNRESPVLTNNSAALVINKNKSALANQIAVSVKSAAPSWAKFYKYYIKDNYSTEYNLLLDRFYDAEDGNYWLSFPSAERNKITEKDILILKKQHGESIPVTLDNEYKVIDIQNEPPESLKLTNLDVLAKAKVKPVSGVSIVRTATPKQVRFLGPSNASNEAFFKAANTARGIQFSRPKDHSVSATELNILSKVYKIKSGGVDYDLDGEYPLEYHFLLEEAVSAGDTAYLNNLTVENHDTVEIIFHGEDNVTGNEYLGRFFVKVEKRASFQQDIITPSQSEEANTVVVEGTPISAIGGNQTSPPNIIYPAFVEDIDARDPLKVNIFVRKKVDVLATTTFFAAGSFRRIYRSIYQEKTVAQLAFGLGAETDTGGSANDGNNPASGSNQFTLAIGPKSAEVNGVQDTFDRTVAGASIRFKNGDNRSEVYTITSGGTAAEKSYTGGHKYDIKTITLNRNYGDEIAVADIDGLEILAESSSQLLTSNPAVFEIKPEKNIDLDIYYEASSAFEIADLNDTKFLDYTNCIAFGNGVESTRIADDFNAPSIGKGVRASSVLKTDFKEETRSSSMIFSGIVNSRTDINNSNQFLIAENITKDINPIHGSIQKLHARDTDLIVLCEDKCFKVLAKKDALFNANGDVNLTASNKVLGQTLPFAGEFGISKNPESFVSYGFRAYFSDKSRGAVLRLSADGLTEISEQGMSNYFENALKGNKAIRGSYDEGTGTYNLSIGSDHASYDEGNRGWCTTLSYTPDFAISLNNTYYSWRQGRIWKHTDTASRANFYAAGSQSSSVTVIFNDAPSSIKNFKTIFYEGDSGWTVDLETDKQKGISGRTINPNLQGSNTTTFFEKEGKYFNFISGDALTWSNALSHSGGTQTGNLDTAELAVQGIATIAAEGSSGDYASATPDIKFASSVVFPNSMQIGDQFFYVNNVSDKIYKLGEITAINQSTGTVTVTKQGSDVPSVLPTAGGGDFAFFVKDTQVNKSGIRGYFNQAKFTNTNAAKNELFAVGTEVFISS